MKNKGICEIWWLSRVDVLSIFKFVYVLIVDIFDDLVVDGDRNVK